MGREGKQARQAPLMPDFAYRGSLLASPMDQILSGIEPSRYVDLYDDDSVWLMGLRIPPFQRELVWSEAQMVRFVESAWLGLHLGTYVVNRWDAMTPEGKFHHTDLWLIDGQQRISALKAYVEDAFPVFGHRWSGLTEIDRRRFGNLPFAQCRIGLRDEADLRLLYNRLNFGGTIHREDQRA